MIDFFQTVLISDVYNNEGFFKLELPNNIH